jgi:hypothetical protein
VTIDEARKQLHTLLQQLSDDQGIQLRNINIEWIETSTVAEDIYLLGLVDIQFSERGGAVRRKL